MKKIGVVTYWNSEENYGQILQIFALQYYLRQKDCYPFLIKHVLTVTDTQSESFFKRLVNLFSSYSKLRDSIRRRLSNIKRNKYIPVIDRHFKEFKDKYIESSSKIYSYQELLNNPPTADGYITGSDQVWNFPNPIFLLNWVNDRVPRFSYAASFGSPVVPDYLRDEYRSSLSRFRLVSVREKSGVDICVKMGIQAEYVLDPTLLLSKDDYLNALKFDSTLRRKPYILLYLLGNRSKIDLEYLKQYAKGNNLDVIFVPSQNFKSELFTPTYPTIEEWLSLIANADLVITNSFHGTVFSILFERLFYTVFLRGKDYKMNERIISLLTDLNLSRSYNNHIDLTERIDYNEVHNLLSEKRHNSFNYLDKIISLI